MKDIQYNKTNSILDDTKQIIETAQSFAYQSINIALVKRNWLLGKRIAEEIKGLQKQIFINSWTFSESFQKFSTR